MICLLYQLFVYSICLVFRLLLRWCVGGPGGGVEAHLHVHVTFEFVKCHYDYINLNFTCCLWISHLGLLMILVMYMTSISLIYRTH